MQQRRVFHVDDDPEIRIIVKMALDLDPDFLVSGADTVSDALDSLQKTADEAPDLLLLDYFVGVTNGIDLLRMVRRDSRLQSIPVAFLTARVLRGEVQHMLSAGAVGVIAKPFNPLTLAQEVRALLELDR